MISVFQMNNFALLRVFAVSKKIIEFIRQLMAEVN